MDPRYRIPETAVELRTEKDPEKGRARIQTEGKHTKTLSTNGSRCIVWNVVLHSESQKLAANRSRSPKSQKQTGQYIENSTTNHHR